MATRAPSRSAPALGEAQPGGVVQALSGGEPVGDAPEVPTVSTEGVGGAPTRSKLIQEGIDQLAEVRTGGPASARGSRARGRLSHVPILAAKGRPSMDLDAPECEVMVLTTGGSGRPVTLIFKLVSDSTTRRRVMYLGCVSPGGRAPLTTWDGQPRSALPEPLQARL